MPQVSCKQCKKRFHAKPSWIKYGNAKYCSSTCQYRGRKNGKTIQCYLCKKKSYKPAGQLLKSKSGKFFCGKSCQTRWRNQEFSGTRHGNWKGGQHIEYRIILLKQKVRQICALCSCRDKRVLCVHHIDQNRKNNRVDNLVWLCYNCHHLVHRHGVVV